jgi:hypothetical protein
MPRARPFTRADVAKRRDDLGVSTALSIGRDCTPAEQKFIDKLSKAAGIAPSDPHGFSYKLKIAIAAYRVRELAHRQERPAAIVAALKPVLKTAKALQDGCTARRKAGLLKRIYALPASLRFDLRAGGLEEMLRTRGKLKELNAALTELIEHGDAKLSQLKTRIREGAPAGSATIGAAFREQVLMMLDEHCPDASEAKRIQWAGDVWAAIGDSQLDPQKHAAQFKGRFIARKNARRGLVFK